MLTEDQVQEFVVKMYSSPHFFKNQIIKLIDDAYREEKPKQRKMTRKKKRKKKKHIKEGKNKFKR
jgi:hypothetical protein